MVKYWYLLLPLLFFLEDYWYFLLPAILMALVPSETIDRVTKKWIPDERKRIKFFLGILITMAALTTVLLLCVTQNLPWSGRIPLSIWPLAAVAIGFLIGRYHKKDK